MARRVQRRYGAGSQIHHLAVGDRTDPWTWNGQDRPEHPAHVLLPERPGGAGLESTRIGEVTRPALVHPDGGIGKPLRERSRSTGVIHMDVRDEDMGQIARGDADVLKSA